MSPIDEGYVKFRCEWRRAGPLADVDIADLNVWRERLYGLKLIGVYSDLGVGYGNLSKRVGGDVIITGTQTGRLSRLTGAHYTRITDFDIEENRVTCEGPAAASSESLTHLAIYALSPDLGAVIHVHHRRAWAYLLDTLPTTAHGVAYGSREMAREFQRLYAETGLPEKRVAVMGGHEEGIVSFGRSLDEAGETLLACLDTVPLEPEV